MKFPALSFITLVIGLLSPGKGAGLRAQTYSFSGSVAVTGTVQSVVVLSVTNNASTTVNLSSSSQYTNGYTIPGFNTIAIKSNMNWTLSLSAATTNFSNSGTYSSANMPASVLKYNVSGQSTKITLSTTTQQLASGSRGNSSASGNTFNVDLTANPGYNYGPGVYTLTTVYTLTGN